MGKHSGDPAHGRDDSPLPVPPDRRSLFRYAAGITAAVVAWGFLVTAAIHFGSQGREGQGTAWFFLFLATIGATACMFVMLILGSRMLSVMRGEPQPTRVRSGGRRASR